MNHIVKANTESEALEMAIRRAQSLLTAGDIDRARIVADSVYVRAKTEAEFARKHGAATHLIDKARRLMADALIIEATSLAALADRVDTQQAAGEISAGGRPRRGSQCASVSDIGLSRDLLYRARRLRDCENERPGIIARTIENQFSAGRMPSRASILRASAVPAGEKSAEAKTATGVNVAALHWYELDVVIRQHEEALEALTRVRDHAVPTDVNLRVRDIIGSRRLAELIAGEG